MTVYFSVIPDITPAMIDWARDELALRQREEAAIRSPADLHAYKRRRGIRRRQAGLSRAICERALEMVATESLERAA